VLAAFQDVEDNLAALRQLQTEAAAQQAATAAANEALRLTENQYLAGTVSYLNVIVTQTTALTAQRSALDIANRRLLASAGLIKALGGRW
jgi:outer membrane protein TolC